MKQGWFLKKSVSFICAYYKNNVSVYLSQTKEKKVIVQF